MDYDRRSLFVASALLMTSGCARASGDTDDTASADKATGPGRLPRRQPRNWQDFKAIYLHGEGRIIDSGNGGISHSEGQGYGMLLAEHAGDLDAFDRMLRWTDETLARPDVALFRWRYAPNEAVSVADPNNATDGDILIAWALVRAHARWQRPDHLRRARQIILAIRNKLIHGVAGRSLLLPAMTGFVAPDRTTVNPCYYVWPALDAFRRVDGAQAWDILIKDGERLAVDARFGPMKLPCDWIDVMASGAVVPAAAKPPRFGFDAIRVPLYQAAGNRRSLTTDVVAYWRGLAGRGADIPAWIDVRTGEQAPYALSAGGLAVVGRVLGTNGASLAGMSSSPGSDYYSDVLALLSQSLFTRGARSAP
ncbi:MAG: endoglucanase [Alphaproteobacteria bacterium]|nr:MAG: endoglucanase [Alphaproteobacteria bacterium]